ncbi:hypothetical protein AVEN_126617-1 [Araneus ventricosus]|uniref:Uncharacterized protein n=1 Tax=Araneus ventricosus TaxID=182803 RepID=A0A4Y2S178_ARAVE|nr:hypothetical protein AVEN_126617-1 [Araneus ventricosus]
MIEKGMNYGVDDEPIPLFSSNSQSDSNDHENELSKNDLRSCHAIKTRLVVFRGRVPSTIVFVFSRFSRSNNEPAFSTFSRLWKGNKQSAVNGWQNVLSSDDFWKE